MPQRVIRYPTCPHTQSHTCMLHPHQLLQTSSTQLGSVYMCPRMYDKRFMCVNSLLETLFSMSTKLFRPSFETFSSGASLHHFAQHNGNSVTSCLNAILGLSFFCSLSMNLGCYNTIGVHLYELKTVVSLGLT